MAHIRSLSDSALTYTAARRPPTASPASSFRVTTNDLCLMLRDDNQSVHLTTLSASSLAAASLSPRAFHSTHNSPSMAANTNGGGGSANGTSSPITLAQQLRDLSTTRQQPLRILTADDNQIHHRILSRMLRKYFADLLEDVDFVDSGFEALEALSRRPYDLVLLDIDMPGLSGVETAERIRAGCIAKRNHDKDHQSSLTSQISVSSADDTDSDADTHSAVGILPVNCTIPIIAVTSSDQAHQRRRYSEIGINDCVSKPVRVDDLRRAISSVALPELATLPPGAPVATAAASN
ncbi:sensitivity to red-light reduced protein [Tieghemiomyces parasiticus]|uniref:Sensitivity to red-light reduced protein n=1 Tax=Tieghemiomyces parasiticus TaxID=78921 RepID=A0A9W7ZYK7_9FUNG|nr:sensitivity to red-light reduced protein [Tieghemiomyces parasiticus]